MEPLADYPPRSTRTKEGLILAAGAALVGAVAAGSWYWLDHGAGAARLAQSEDPAARLQAVRQLRGKSSALALRTLRRLCEDPDVRVAVQAVRALGAGGGRAGGKALKALLANGKRGRVRGEAAAALGLYESTPVELLGERLRITSEPDPDARIGAAKGLARLGKSAGLKELLHVLENDDDPRVRAVAVVAIQKIIGVRFRYDPTAPHDDRAEQVGHIRAALERAKLP